MSPATGTDRIHLAAAEEELADVEVLAAVEELPPVEEHAAVEELAAMEGLAAVKELAAVGEQSLVLVPSEKEASGVAGTTHTAQVAGWPHA